MLEEHATEDLVSGYEGWEAEVIQLLQVNRPHSNGTLQACDAKPNLTLSASRGHLVGYLLFSTVCRFIRTDVPS